LRCHDGIIAAMQDFSCLKCGQVVQAERLPHSCPRCYSPATEAYVDSTEGKDSVEMKFDVSGAFEGAPGWEQSLTTMELEVPDEIAGEIDSPGQIDEGRLEEATSTPGSQRGHKANKGPEQSAGLSATTTQELDEEDFETEVYRKIDRIEQQRAAKTVPPPTPTPEPTAERREAREVPSPRAPAPKSRRVAPRTHQQAPVSRPRRETVPPTMEAQPTGKSPRRREATRRQRRIPTAQNERVTDTLRSGKRKRLLVALWVVGLLVLGLAAVRLFVYPDEGQDTRKPLPVAVVLPDVGAAAPAALAAPDASVPVDLTPIADRGALVADAPSVAQPAAGTGAKPRAGKPKPKAGKPKLKVGKPKPKADKPKPKAGKPKPKVGKPKVGKPKAGKPKPKAGKPKVSAKIPSKLSPADRAAAARALYRKGIQQLLLGQTRGAVARFKKALATQRSFALAYRGLGLAHQKLGHKKAARSAFSRYLALRPNAADAGSIRARIQTLK
jgi:hypothetical protein